MFSVYFFKRNFNYGESRQIIIDTFKDYYLKKNIMNEKVHFFV